MAKKDNTEDRATAYALSVTNGDTVAGPYVRGACLRHLHDLEKAKGDWPYYYDRKEAEKTFRFFEENLKLNGGQFEGKPFLLIPWESFVVGAIFGWKQKENGFRRFQLAFILTGKGSGKSPIAAAFGLKGLCADGEPRAEIYSCATYKDQAAILFRDAVAFYHQSEELRKRLQTSGGEGKEWNLYYPKNHSFFKIISSDKSKSGPRPHMYIADEVHEHKDGTVIGLLEKGFKFRRQPLGIEITNAGSDVTSFCWERAEMGRKVACELEENDKVFAYICAMDQEDLKDDNYLYNEAVWEKANPSIEYGIPGYDYVRKQVKDAEGMPSQLSMVKRLCFCVWTESDNPWISGQIWNPLEDKDYDPELLVGRRCWAGLDLSTTQDLTASVYLFEPTIDDPYWRLVPFFWLPKDGLERKAEIDHVRYDVWERQGYIFTCEGPAISKTQVIKHIASCHAQYDLQGVAYDRSRMNDLIEFAKKEGIELDIGKWDKEKREWKFKGSGIKMMPFGQEARSMAPAIDKFETMLITKAIRHDGNPCMTWNASNAVVKVDEENYRKVSKSKSTGRVDGVVAAVMAAGVTAEQTSGSSYEGKTAEEIKRMMMI